jgi:hypothetical protein
MIAFTLEEFIEWKVAKHCFLTWHMHEMRNVTAISCSNIPEPPAEGTLYRLFLSIYAVERAVMGSFTG